MKILTFNANNVIICAPAYPYACSFVFFKNKHHESNLTSDLFPSYIVGTETLSTFIEKHKLEQHVTPDFDSEYFFDCGNGLKCCIGTDYIRFIDSESLNQIKSMYWTMDEIVDDFSDVFGAIIGFMCSYHN